MKSILQFNPVFTPGASGVGTLDFSGYAGFTLRNLVSVVNVTRGKVIYGPTDSREVRSEGTISPYFAPDSLVGSLLTLESDTSAQSAADILECWYDDGESISVTIDPAAMSSLATSALQSQQLTALNSINTKLPALQDGLLPVNSQNIATKFREAFEAYPNANWNQTLGSGDLVYADGNAAGASYLVVSKNPLAAGTETSIETVDTFRLPIELSIGAHMSQRTLGQEFSLEVVDTQSLVPDIPDIQIDSIIQTTTTLTVNTLVPHGLSVGRSIGTRQVLDSRVNYPSLVIATVPSPTQFTVTAGPGGTIPSLSSTTATVAAATTAALPANAYNNGTSGVGATLTASANGAFPAQDGVTLTSGQKLLVKNEAAAANNGVYVLTQVGSESLPWILTRDAAFDQAGDLTVVAGALFAVSVVVASGATQQYKQFYLSATVTTVGTTAVTFLDSGTNFQYFVGFVFVRQRMGRAQNGVSQIFENTTATNSSMYIRSASGDALPTGTIAGNQSATINTTASIQLAGAVPYTYSFSPTSEYRMYVQVDRTQWVDSAVDATGQTSSRAIRTQVCPDPSVDYKFRVRATNNKSLTLFVSQILSAVKTGTTTATITTTTNHGLLVGDIVQVYGLRAQGATEFPNLTTAAAVLSTPSATQFTIAIGTAGTVTSFGGFVARVNGGVTLATLGTPNISLQSAALTTLSDGTRQLTVVGNATFVGAAAIGDLVELVGVRDNVAGVGLSVDGPWKVASIATTTLTLVLPYSGQRSLPDNFATIAAPTACGGAIIRRTDLRLSFIRIFDYERERVELLPRPSGDMAASVPIVAQGGTIAAVTGVTTVSTVTTLTSMTSGHLGIPLTVADVASAALTTTTTTATITPASGVAYTVNIPVTAVTGTNPTLDVSIEESDDAGTNWFKVYDFPRITATGIYRSSVLKLRGNRVRYVQTVGGTTPSFTRSVNRLQANTATQQLVQLIDRTIVPNTLNSTSGVLYVEGCIDYNLYVRCTAQTTAATIDLQISDDNTNWFTVAGASITTVNGIARSVATNIQARFARAIVSAAGTGITLSELTLKAVGN